MRTTHVILAAAAMAVSAPAIAGFALMPEGQQAVVGKSSLKVTPNIPWNRQKGRIGPQAETWTLDGSALNEVVFYTGVASDQTLLRDTNKKNKPLPKFTSAMLPTDVAQLLEQTYRIAIDTPLFEVQSIAPATFGGRPGFKFSFSYTAKKDDVRRKGEAIAAIVGGRLYMMTYTAPEIYYYDRNVASFWALANSAALN